MGALQFLHRMAEAVEVESGAPLIREDAADDQGNGRTAYEPLPASGSRVMVYRISGAFFFGATAAVSTVLDRIGERTDVFVLDFAEVPLVDSTAAKTLERFVHKLRAHDTRVYVAGARKSVLRSLLMA